jgi:hypothetical protein
LFEGVRIVQLQALGVGNLRAEESIRVVAGSMGGGNAFYWCCVMCEACVVCWGALLRTATEKDNFSLKWGRDNEGRLRLGRPM